MCDRLGGHMPSSRFRSRCVSPSFRSIECRASESGADPNRKPSQKITMIAASNVKCKSDRVTSTRTRPGIDGAASWIAWVTLISERMGGEFGDSLAEMSGIIWGCGTAIAGEPQARDDERWNGMEWKGWLFVSNHRLVFIYGLLMGFP